MKKQTLKALQKKLDDLNINHFIKDDKLWISDENQPEDVYITDWDYDNVLNGCLNDIIDWLDERGYNFECEWAGTFSLCLMTDKG